MWKIIEKKNIKSKVSVEWVRTIFPALIVETLNNLIRTTLITRIKIFLISLIDNDYFFWIIGLQMYALRLSSSKFTIIVNVFL